MDTLISIGGPVRLSSRFRGNAVLDECDIADEELPLGAEWSNVDTSNVKLGPPSLQTSPGLARQVSLEMCAGGGVAGCLNPSVAAVQRNLRPKSAMPFRNAQRERQDEAFQHRGDPASFSIDGSSGVHPMTPRACMPAVVSAGVGGQPMHARPPGAAGAVTARNPLGVMQPASSTSLPSTRQNRALSARRARPATARPTVFTPQQPPQVQLAATPSGVGCRPSAHAVHEQRNNTCLKRSSSSRVPGNSSSRGDQASRTTCELSDAAEVLMNQLQMQAGLSRQPLQSEHPRPNALQKQEPPQRWEPPMVLGSQGQLRRSPSASKNGRPSRPRPKSAQVTKLRTMSGEQEARLWGPANSDMEDKAERIAEAASVISSSVSWSTGVPSVPMYVPVGQLPRQGGGPEKNTSSRSRLSSASRGRQAQQPASQWMKPGGLCRPAGASAAAASSSSAVASTSTGASYHTAGSSAGQTPVPSTSAPSLQRRSRGPATRGPRKASLAASSGQRSKASSNIYKVSHKYGRRDPEKFADIAVYPERFDWQKDTGPWTDCMRRDESAKYFTWGSQWAFAQA
mmetsp:Transcript_99339/g.206933  ORF Transcript_99339/g.206933 Transcript_99339/m.206933 type:complete len:569 (-) Transcript_99339:178-1884(-)